MTERGEAGAGPDAGVGEELARARAALGYSIAEVTQQLKFAERQIEALEQGRYEELPAGTFARGMVRAYARLLKLDPAPLVERIAARVAVPDNAAAVASVRRPIPITDNARRSNLTYAAFSLAILAAIAAMALEWQRERSAAAQLRFVPAAQAPHLATQGPIEQPTTVASAVAQPNLVPLTHPEPAAPAAVPAAATDGKSGMKRIAMKFERASWVEIRGGDGKPLISQLNSGGTEQTVEGRPPFALVIGNAQHVRLSYDDRPVDLAPHVKVEVARFTLE